MLKKVEKEQGRKRAGRPQEGKADKGTQIHSRESRWKMPNFAGNWKMKSSENFDELLKALGKRIHLVLFCYLEQF